MTGKTPLRVYLVDDEPLALKRLSRLLRQTGRVEIAGSALVPGDAVEFLSRNAVDAVFLDIQMPGMTGFELLQKLPKEPAVVFTTAFDKFALNAFEVNSVDYLVKPIELERLERALRKLERLRGTPQTISENEQLRALASALTRKFPDRLASRLGERVVFVEVKNVSHFYAKDKLTYAATPAKDFVIDFTVRNIDLTQRGQDRLDELTDATHQGDFWKGRRRRAELVTQALVAKYCYIRDEQYLVTEDQKVQIIDEFTGRVMADRSWRHGLHQAIEVKENVPVTADKENLARLSFQRFFRQYPIMGGMTGTAWEANGELWQIYQRPLTLVQMYCTGAGSHLSERNPNDGDMTIQLATADSSTSSCRSFYRSNLVIGVNFIHLRRLLSCSISNNGKMHLLKAAPEGGKCVTAMRLYRFENGNDIGLEF